MSSPDSLLDESPPPIPTTEGLADEMFSDSEAEARAAMNSQAELVGSDVESDVEDEDIAPNSRRKGGAESHRNDDDDDMDQTAEDEGLFGSDDDGDRDEAGETPPNHSRHRSFDDSELDSGDDEDRRDRAARVDGEGEQDEESATIQDVQLGRHPVPEGSDGELYLLKLPSFLSINPTAFHHKTFQPPLTDHHSTGPPSSTFNAYNVALTNLRWRRSPHDPEKLESNARILRWSDGSLTLQLATNPTEQYELPAKALAPPQHNPVRPTPTSVQSRNAVNGTKATTYNSQADAHTYLTTPHESASLLRTTNHLTTSLTVLPSSEFNDEALIRLHDSLAKAVRGKSGVDGGIARIIVTEDPELQKKRAEAAEKEKLKAQRRKEQAEQRERQRMSRVNSMRQGSRYAAGLNAGALEDDDMATSGGAGRKRPAMNKKKVARRRDDYESDEDDMQRYSTREDEYDRADGFLADSDEEEEEYEGDDKEDDEDIDEGIDEVDEEAEEKQKRADRKRERKDERRRDGDNQRDQEAAEAAAGGASRAKRRRVVDDDDE
ncbi:MAG: hypothetical protein M1813_004346 [Trichoglossum hirsutum]|nr:MAG: hypothetical protein M1813_004346 [Trichoglossum hirsutum]